MVEPHTGDSARRTARNGRSLRRDRFVLVTVAACLCLTPGLARGLEVDSTLYFPLMPGDHAVFRQNGIDEIASTVLQGSANINGSDTLVAEVQGGEYSGSRTYQTSDQQGLRVHRIFYADLFVPGFGFTDSSITFSPPMKLAESIQSIGVLQHGGGTATLEYEGLGSITLDYTSTSRMVGFEPVSVPHGSYDALKQQ
jgi:hypothetical protein